LKRREFISLFGGVLRPLAAHAQESATMRAVVAFDVIAAEIGLGVDAACFLQLLVFGREDGD
jgi:hypothetical protein